jgi:hypothetical protein
MFDFHNQRAASMPMMVGMMVCAVVVVGAAQAHNLSSIPARVFYTRRCCRVSMKLGLESFIDQQHTIHEITLRNMGL